MAGYERWDDFLIAEHEMIERAMSVLKENLDKLDAGDHDSIQIQRAVDFLLEFGDKIHNQKEEGFLFPLMQERGIPVVWRCHVGIDHDNEYTEEAWSFLRGFLEGNVDQYVFTRASYAPSWVPPEKLRVIKPSIDPLAPKNQDLGEADILGALRGAGIIEGSGFGSAS